MEIRVFEPALCCNTGVCGTDVDQNLVNFTADLASLKELGVEIQRHNLANDPVAFAENEILRSFLEVAGSDGLPLTLVNGVTVMTGTYPSREQLLKFSGQSSDREVGDHKAGENLELIEKSESCCGGSGCC